MKRFFLLLMLCLSLAVIHVPSVQAARYTGDDTLYKLDDSSDIKSNNGLIFSPVFDVSGQFPTVAYQVLDGRVGKNDLFLGTTRNYQVGDREIVKFGGVSVELWTYNTGILSGEPWVEVRVKSLVSVEEFRVSNIQVTNLAFRYPLVAPSVTFNSTIPITSPKILYCKGLAQCAIPVEAVGNNFYSTNHAVTLGKGLENNSIYYYKIQGTTEAGDIAEDDNGGSWYVLQTSPAPLASIQNLTVTAGDTGVTIYFKTPEDSYVIIDYGVSSVKEFQETPNAYGKEHIILLGSLSRGTTYRYQITLQKAGDLTNYTQSKESSFTTKASLVLFSGVVEMTAPTSANITWNTDQTCRGEVWYRLKGVQTHDVVTEDNYLKAHWGRLTELRPSSSYEYRLGCVIINDGRKAMHPEDGAAWLEFNTTQALPVIEPTPIAEQENSQADERIRKLNIILTNNERSILEKETNLTSNVDKQLADRLTGKILLQVEERGEAWYVDEVTGNRYYMQDGVRAYDFLRAFGLGISNQNLNQIPIGIEARADKIDTDGDGVDDKLEDALGTKNDSTDSDSDGFSDFLEIVNGYNPNGPGTMPLSRLGDGLEGKILLQVESRGEAWYVHNGKRYYMKDGLAAYQIMRYLSLGVSNTDLRKIQVGQFE